MLLLNLQLQVIDRAIEFVEDQQFLYMRMLSTF